MSLPGGRPGGIIGLVVVVVVALLGGGSLLSGGEGGSGGGGGSGTGLPDVFNQFPGMGPAPSGSELADDAPDPDRKLVDFVAFVIDDIQKTWTAEFQRAGRAYDPTKLVIFSNQVQTGCGPASSATGPFYCPADRRVYLDLRFFRELRDRFGAPGDFAQAYVIAHEVGHHIQTLTGINAEVRRASQADPRQANPLSIRLELQADCLAGVWAHSTYSRGILEPGDIEEGLAAAAAVGDDRIQKSVAGRVTPETWTHGSSEQRTRWFRRGFESGSAESCDAFAAGAQV